MRPLTIGIHLMLAVALLQTTACDSVSPDAQDLPSLPAEAIGVVSVGPLGPPIDTRKDHTWVYAFNKAGKLLGKVEGGAVWGSRVVSWKRQFTTATADAVVTISSGGRQSTRIDENMPEGIAQDPRTGRSLFWFNTGKPGGPGTPYINNYILTATESEPRSASMIGFILNAAHCGDHAYAIVADEGTIGSAAPTVTQRLYELPFDGGKPLLKAQWDYPQLFRPATTPAVCSSDGRVIYSLYRSYDPHPDTGNQTPIELVQFDASTGARSESPTNLTGRGSPIRTNTLTLVADRLYWIAYDGAVMSLPIDGPPEVREEWISPASGDKHQATVSGNTVAHIDTRGTPTYSEYRLLTGERAREPIPLPWLKSLIGSTTESGKSIYGVTGVATLSG